MALMTNRSEDYNVDIKKWIEDTWEFGISNSMMNILMLALSVILHGVLSLAGVVSNSVNVLVFIRLGLKDSMSVGLWALSFTDLVISVLPLAGCIAYLVAIIYPYCPIDPWFIGSYYLGFARYVGYFISCWITTIIALERCYCVVAPFRVKQVFTKTKCVVSISVIALFHIAMLIPIYVFPYFEWNLRISGQHDENGTDIYFLQMQLHFTVEMAEWQFINTIVVGVVLSVTSQVLIIQCTFWMIYSLKASSRIRKLAESENREATDNLSAGEKRLVKVVILLAIIQTACNIPRFLATIAMHHLLPGAELGTYNNICMFMWEVSYIFGTICCASNILVYLKLNSNFKRQFHLIFNIENITLTLN